MIMAAPNVQKPYQRLSGSTLKIIAMIVMTIDHAAAVLLYQYVAYTPMSQEQWGRLNLLYQIMRIIGRSAFPIFCFLLCEGFIHTGSRMRQAGRLLVFALLSEMPFDLAISGRLTWKSQNVFFTLLAGYLVIWGIDSVRRKMAGKRLPELAVCLLILWTGIYLAEMFHTDYGASGVLLIVILYLFRFHRMLACFAGYLSMLWEAWCFPAFILIQGYNGKRGLSLKYIFYLFYPVHLAVFYLITKLLIL